MTMTQQIFGNVEKILIDEGTVYYPLLSDPPTERDVSLNGIVKERDNCLYVKGLEISNAIKSYSQLHKADYERIKVDFLKRALPDFDINKILYGKCSANLRTIIFGVMPHFIERKGLERKKIDEKEIIKYIRENRKIPQEYYDKARDSYDPSSLKTKVGELENLEIAKNIFPEGLMAPEVIDYQIKSELEREILKEERSKLNKELKIREASVKEGFEDLATLLFLQDQTEFEFGDFGVTDNTCPQTTAYVKIPEYALRDFDRRVYLFPKCKIGVSIGGGEFSGGPVVIEKYKHPFLGGKGTNQIICIRGGLSGGKEHNERIVHALETGINTILFGYYNYSGFNGYSKLSGNSEREIYFKDYLIEEDDEKIRSGKVKITNDPFMGEVRR